MIIVFNPVAGRRRAQLLWRVLDIMVANGIRIELAETTRRGHAETIARAAAQAGKTLVVAAGGDGTIAEVANGLMGSTTRLGVIPLGTANVLAHELNLPFAPAAVAAALAFGRTRPLWPGICFASGGAATGTSGGAATCTSGGAATGTSFGATGVGAGDGTGGCQTSSRLFVQMLGVGFDAHVVAHLSIPLKRAIGRTAYALQTLRELPRYDFAPIRLRLDGTEIEAASAIVSKGRLYAGTYTLAPEARPGEPGFSVALFQHSGAWPALMYGAALPLDQLYRAPGVRHLRASRVDFIGNRQVPAQADGDPAGYTPLSIADAPGPIHVVVG